jgi:hypothetical protein
MKHQKTLVRVTNMFPHRSSIITPAYVAFALRLSTDSFLYALHLADHSLPGKADHSRKNYIQWRPEEKKPLLLLPDNFFDDVDTLSETSDRDIDWKCVYTADDANTKETLDDIRMELLAGCRIKHREDGFILEDISIIMYTPRCTTWTEFELEEFDYIEENVPLEQFGLDLQQNLMGFYYRLSRYPTWSPAVCCLARMIAREYYFRVDIGFKNDYLLEYGELFLISKNLDGTDDKGLLAEDWTSIFYYLGRRLMSKQPVTLWSDVFALSILLSEIPEVQVALQPCFVEQHIDQNSKAVEVRLRMLSLKSMEVLHTGDAFPVNCRGQYLIIPLYLYHHNPCVIQSLKTVTKSFRDREHYTATLLDGLLDYNFLSPSFVKAFPKQGEYPKQGQGGLFYAPVEDTECTLCDLDLLIEIRQV